MRETMRQWMIVLVMIAALAHGLVPSWAANTHGIPDSAAELRAILGDINTPFVRSGCLPAVPVSSATLAAFACAGYVRGTSGELVYTTQASAAVTLSGGDGTYWLALQRATTGTVSGWTRQAGTGYVWAIAAAKPADPAGGLIVAKVTVAGSVVTAIEDHRRPASYARAGVFDVTDPLYGAVDDDTTNSRTAITAAIKAASVSGGTVYFPKARAGIYLVSGAGGTVDLPVPVATADFQPETQSLQYQFYVESVTGLRFKGDGVVIRSDVTNGGQVFLFNGVRDLVIDGLTIRGVHAYNGSGVTTVAGMNALAFTSTTQDSERILIQNYRSEANFAGVYVFGSPASSFRVRGMTLENVLTVNTHYGLAFHDNGSNVDFRGVRTVGGVRSYFVYGVFGHDGQIVVDAGSPNVINFNAILIKAYDLNTENIALKVRYNKASSSTKVDFQSQHNVAAQATPALVRNIVLDYNEHGFAGGGGVNFSYYQDNSVQATSSAKIFNNITLRGIFENDITTQTVFSGVGRVKLNIQDVVFITGSPSILNGNGFTSTPQFTYTPELLIGGASTGITYSTQIGEYYEIGNMIFGNLHIKLSSKGALSGSLTVTLPRAMGTYATTNAVVSAIAYDNLDGLTGTVQGFVNTSASYLSLLQTSATGKDDLTHQRLTDTSEFLITFAYPK